MELILTAFWCEKDESFKRMSIVEEAQAALKKLDSDRNRGFVTERGREKNQ